MFKYFKSSQVKVFPSAYRGTFQSKNNVTIFDPTSRLNVESNFVLPKNSLKDSYIINYNKTTETLKVVLGGYYFEISNVELSDFVKDTDIYVLCIKLIDKTIDNQNTTKILGSWEENTDLILDKELEDIYYFTGLRLMNINSISGADYYLQIVDENGNLYQPSLLPGINHSFGENSLSAGYLTKANNTNSIAFGENTITNNDNQLVIGKNNESKDYTLFEVGSGYGETRKNAFEVYGTREKGFIKTDQATIGTIINTDLTNENASINNLNNNLLVSDGLENNILNINQLSVNDESGSSPIINKKIRKYLVDLFYPKGSYYYTDDLGFDPNIEWGGEWNLTDASGRFLFGAGVGVTESGKSITYTTGKNYGDWVKEYTSKDFVQIGEIKLTVDNLPLHTHSYANDTEDNGNHSHIADVFGCNESTTWCGEVVSLQYNSNGEVSKGLAAWTSKSGKTYDYYSQCKFDGKNFINIEGNGVHKHHFSGDTSDGGFQNTSFTPVVTDDKSLKVLNMPRSKAVNIWHRTK